jgi:phosphomannomutase
MGSIIFAFQIIHTMTLIQSISGMRGTLGGKQGEALTPVDVLKFTGAFGMHLRNIYPGEDIAVVIGRDARISGDLVSMLVIATLKAMGIHIIDGGVTTTPTVAMGVVVHRAHGGIVITASHNPKNWNALKFLDHRGEFLQESEAMAMSRFMSFDDMEFATIDKLGTYTFDETLLEKHIEKIIALPLVDVEAIREAGFVVAVDGINSSGGTAVPLLLKTLGVKDVIEVFCEPTGLFSHNPEPLPEHLTELSQQVVSKGAHLGFAVDPDVDRLAIVSEDGDFFGEEYTLVAVADYVLSMTPGNTVSNLSSTQALKDVTEKYGASYFSSAVGEANVVKEMKRQNAVIGGEGNGGVIYPPLHYGRDALLGIALFLTHLARSGKSSAMLKKKYPAYFISKNKVELPADTNMQGVLEKFLEKYGRQPNDTTDGIKIWFGTDWVHLRRSNTEPIIRIYAESDDETKANNLTEKIMLDIREILKGDEE